MAGIKKVTRPKTGGRRPGSKNRFGGDLRTRLKTFLDEYSIQTLESDFYALRPSDRVAMFEKLMRFVLPTLQSVQTKLDVSSMTDDEVNHIFNALIK